MELKTECVRTQYYVCSVPYYLECHGRYLGYHGRCSVPWGNNMIQVGISSAPRWECSVPHIFHVQYHRISINIWEYHSSESDVWSPKVFMKSFRVQSIPMVLKFPPQYSRCFPGTEHTLYRAVTLQGGYITSQLVSFITLDVIFIRKTALCKIPRTVESAGV